MIELPEQIRAFIALKVPDNIVHEVVKTQHQLKSRLDDVSWTRADAIHLTLHFFGNVASADLPAIAAALQDVAARFEPFSLSVHGIGSFGNRVIWAGLAGDCAALKSVAEATRAAVSKFGSHSEDREFSGHVTLGRLRRPRGGVAAKLREFAEREFGSWKAGELELIRSELSPRGARYTVLAVAPLRVD